MGHRSHYHRLTSFIVGILTFISFAIASPGIASSQTRIISLSGDLDFGTLPLGTSAQRTLIISNLGDSTLTISNLYYPPEPVLVQVDFKGTFSGPIPPRGAEFIPITFTPLGTSINGGSNDLDFQGFLFVDSDATSGNSSIAMSGVGTWPPLTPSLYLDFGNVSLGDNQSITLLLANLSDSPVTVNNTTVPDDFAFPFETSRTIEPHSATNLDVLFFPAQVTNYKETALLTSDTTDPVVVLMTPNGNVTNSDTGAIVLGLSGTGTYPSGKFVGLFAPINNPAFENSGYLTAESTAKGKLRATLTLANKRYPFSAQVSPSGVASAAIKRKKLPNLNVSLQFNADSRHQWTGTIDDGTWTSALKMEPIVRLTKQSFRAVPVGQYTISLSGSTNALIAPTDQGAGTLDVKVSGAVRVKGTLGDGTVYSLNTMLCNSDIPFYTPLYRGKGAILGWLSIAGGFRLPPPGGIPLTNIITFPRETNPIAILLPSTNYPITIPIIIIPGETNPIVVMPFTNAPIKILPQRSTEVERQIIGTLNWFKPAGIAPDYPDGFSFQTTVTGSIP